MNGGLYTAPRIARAGAEINGSSACCAAAAALAGMAWSNGRTGANPRSRLGARLMVVANSSRSCGASDPISVGWLPVPGSSLMIGDVGLVGGEVTPSGVTTLRRTATNW